MNGLEALRTASDNLRAHTLRSLLTTLGTIFGVGAVIAMLAIGEGAERQALGMIQRLGLSNVLVRARELDSQLAAQARTQSLGLSRRDGAAVSAALPQVENVAARIRVRAESVRSRRGRSEAKVYGVSPEYPRLVRLELAEGRHLDSLDERTHAQVAVLGARARRDLFGAEPALGGEIKIDDVWLEVVGVLSPSAAGAATFQGVGIGSSLDEIYLPASTAERKFRRDPLAAPVDELVVHLKSGASAAEAAAQIGPLLTRLHAGEEDYELIVPEALLEQSRRTQRLFRVVMGSIAAISLLVGGIGIMNIMLATVFERISEIGVRRAVGARRRDVRFQFLLEALALSVTGGLLGILFGVALAKLVALWAGWNTLVTPGAVLLATGVSTLVGLTAGLYPAHRAALVDPIEALRHE